MLHSFFDHEYSYCKSTAILIKQYLDHNSDEMSPETQLIFTQAIEHLIYGFVYARQIDRYLSKHKNDETLIREVDAELDALTQSECLQCQV